MKIREKFVIVSIITVVLILALYQFWNPILWIFYLLAQFILMGIYDIFQTKHTIRRNFPVLGRFRYMLESVRPEIMQYFVETDTQGRPLNRIFRSLIYQRSKRKTIPHHLVPK